MYVRIDKRDQRLLSQVYRVGRIVHEKQHSLTHDPNKERDYLHSLLANYGRFLQTQTDGCSTVLDWPKNCFIIHRHVPFRVAVVPHPNKEWHLRLVAAYVLYVHAYIVQWDLR